MRKSYLAKRVSMGIMSIAITVSTILGSAVNVSAAPVESVSNTVINDTTYVNVTAVDNKKVAEDALERYIAALKKNSAAEIQDALKKIAALTPTQKIHLFKLMYKKYYKLHFLDANFRFFDVKEYISTYPEVANKYSKLSGNALYEAVLDDYLENGLFEGKSSCTDFNPVIAILVYPEETLPSLMVGFTDAGAGLSAIFNSYIAVEKNPSTRHYKIASDFLGQRYAKSYAEQSDFNNLFIVKNNPMAANIGQDSVAEYETNSENHIVDILPYSIGDLINVIPSQFLAGIDFSKNRENEKTPSREEEPFEPIYEPEGGEGEIEYNPVNARASRERVEAFKLYSTDIPGDYIVSSRVKYVDKDYIGTDGYIEKEVNGKFYNDTYKSIIGDNDRKPKAKTTVILYGYGTDLETGTGGFTISIGEILKKGYAPEDLNIIVLAGGTKSYENQWLNSNSGNFNCDIYYIDPSALEFLSSDERATLSGAVGIEGYNNANAINRNTLKLLGSYGQTDFGSANLLAGMIDMTVDLFSADNYMIVFNDHGGGINGGIGSPEAGSEGFLTTLAMDEIEEGIASSDFIMNGNRFDVIGFDACLMGGIEVAYNMSLYGKYMLACEETEAGSWDYQDLVNRFANTSKESLRQDVVSFAKDCVKGHPGGFDIIQSFTVFDLDNVGCNAYSIDLIGSAFNKLYSYNSVDSSASDEVVNELKKDVYFAMRSARAKSYANGADNKSNLFEYADMYSYMSNLKEAIEKVKTKWADNPGVVATINECTTSIDNLISNPNNGAIEYAGIRYDGEYVYDVDAANPVGYNQEMKLSYEEIASRMDSSASFWTTLKNAGLCGTSIYVPYYSGDGYDGRYDDYVNQNLINNYTELVKSYIGYRFSDENVDRLNRLKEALGQLDNGGYCYNYEDMFGQAESGNITKTIGNETKTISYISVPIKSEYVAAKSNDVIKNDSVDPYTDFTDVLKDIKVYTLMNQKLDNGDMVDLVIGQTTLNIDPIDGKTEKVNIVLADYKAYEVSGYINGGVANKTYNEYALAQAIDNYIADLFGKDAAKLVMFEGDAKIANQDTKEQSYAVYEMDPTYLSTYKYLGNVKYDYDASDYILVNDVESFKFYQYKAGDSIVAYTKSDEATDMSWEYDMRVAPLVILNLSGIDSSNIDKYEVELVLDISHTDFSGYRYDESSYVAKIDSPELGRPDKGDNPTTFYVMDAVSPESHLGDGAESGDDGSIRRNQEMNSPKNTSDSDEEAAKSEADGEISQPETEEIMDGTGIEIESEECSDSADNSENIGNSETVTPSEDSETDFTECEMTTDWDNQSPLIPNSTPFMPTIPDAISFVPEVPTDSTPVTTGEDNSSNGDTDSSGDNGSDSGESGSDSTGSDEAA